MPQFSHADSTVRYKRQAYTVCLYAYVCINKYVEYSMGLYVLLSTIQSAATVKDLHCDSGFMCWMSEIVHYSCPSFSAPGIWNSFSGCWATWQHCSFLTPLWKKKKGCSGIFTLRGSFLHKGLWLLCLCACLRSIIKNDTVGSCPNTWKDHTFLDWSL